MQPQFYLKKLIIQNFATFKNQSINFRPGFNAIIGETGSGKSLVLDALQLILGGRADKKVVRRETEYALLEASFYCDDQKVREFLEAEGFPIDGKEIIIKRLIYRNGSTKNYINHLTCTVTFLASFARKYIDLVGQFENQKLLSESYQLYLLDHYAKQLDVVTNFQNMVKNFRKLTKEKEQLVLSKTMREQRLDYLIFQLQEIETLNPSSQDEEHLLKKKNALMNREKIQRVCFQMKEVFEGSEEASGIAGQLKLLSHLCTKNADLMGDYLGTIAEIEDKLFTLQSEIETKLSFEDEDSDLESVLERLDMYQKLKKKFGGTVESILQTQVDFMKEKVQLESLEFDLEQLEKNIELQRKALDREAEVLHKRRLEASKKLSQEMTKKVRNLNMNGATLKIEIEKHDELTETGFSRALFVAETNPGEGYFKIKDIASGGELSRILLSLRQILSAYDSISIFLFDEIDTGIGGETANCIGKALGEVASHGQVIAITHLPQIAQFAEALIMVHKDILAKEKEARTESTVKEIFGKMIMKEVKAMAQLA